MAASVRAPIRRRASFAYAVWVRSDGSAISRCDRSLAARLATKQKVSESKKGSRALAGDGYSSSSRKTRGEAFAKGDQTRFGAQKKLRESFPYVSGFNGVSLPFFRITRVGCI